MWTGNYFADKAILIVIIAAIIALVFIALEKFGIMIPDWVIQIGWILIVAFVIVFAIRLLSNMGNNEKK